jgi:ribosomal protein S18 acetylase RimI-like enzyme
MSGTRPVIRLARPEDADAVTAMFVLNGRLHEGYDGFRWSHAPDAEDAWRQYFLRQLEKASGFVLVAVDGEDCPVAFLLGDLTAPPPSSAIRCRGFVGDLFVMEEHRGRGVGKALMAEAERIMKERGAELIELFVAVANARARAFYRSLGMKPLNEQMYKRL